MVLTKSFFEADSKFCFRILFMRQSRNDVMDLSVGRFLDHSHLDEKLQLRFIKFQGLC